MNQGVENTISATWAADTDEGTQHYRSHWALAWFRLRRNKAALLGAVIVLLLIFAAIFAPLLAPHDPNQPFDSGMTMDGSPTSPNSTFIFGADTLGRDLFSRILYGARISLTIGIVANGLAMIIGVSVGLVGGYFSGWVGTLVMRITDVMMAFPVLLLAIALVAVLKPSLWIVIGVIAFVYWTPIARIVHGQVLTIKEREFVEAARAVGAGQWRIVFRHVLPHLVPVIIVYTTLGIATNVLFEAALSFLGVGVQPPTPSWGAMISDGQNYYRSAPWLVLYPGLAIMLTVLGFSLLGDGLRDALDSGLERLTMAIYIARRLLLAVLVIIGVSIITFILAYLVPADPARVYAGSNASAATVASIREQLGLNRPLPVQYLEYVGRALHGDFGTSYKLQTPVLSTIETRFPYTAALAGAGILVELLIGIPIGIISAARPRSWLDRGAMGFAMLGVSAPQFWLGLVLLYTFGYLLPIFPLGLAQSPSSIVLPAITVGLSGGVWYARVLRSAMLETLNADYTRTARAKGLRRIAVILRHALPNAITPIVTQLGLDMAYFLGGIVVVESVFGWPGVGQLAYQAIQNDDIPLIMGTVLFSAIVIVLINIFIDILYAVLNPRVVYG